MKQDESIELGYMYLPEKSVNAIIYVSIHQWYVYIPIRRPKCIHA